MKGLATALILKEKIQTTEAKAKEASPYVERFITIAKKGDLNSKRNLLKFLAPKVVKKLIDELAPRYKVRKGGYTRVIKLGQRLSDGSRMALIEFIK